MTTAFSDSTHIDASPAQVWAALTDWDRAGQWMPGVTGMRLDGPLAVGSVLHFVARGKDRTSTVTALDAGRSITLSSTVAGVHADYRYDIVPDGSGTRVDLVADVRTSGPMKLLGRTIRSSIAKEDGVQLTRFAAMLGPAASVADA